MKNDARSSGGGGAPAPAKRRGKTIEREKKFVRSLFLTEFIFLTSVPLLKNPAADVMWRATILCSVGPFYRHRPINLDTPRRKDRLHAPYTRTRVHKRRVVCGTRFFVFFSPFFFSFFFTELLTAYNRFGRSIYIYVLLKIYTRGDRIIRG